VRIVNDLGLRESAVVLSEEEKTCSCCGGPRQRIGEDESRELEYIPARLEVRVHVLPKYACPKCRDGVASPPVPPKPTPGGMAGPGLVAFVVVSKFADHPPLYRLEDILTRHGVHLSRSTPCDWVRDAAILLEPLAALRKALVSQSPVIWTDDTP
jgi:transposase